MSITPPPTLSNATPPSTPPANTTSRSSAAPHDPALMSLTVRAKRVRADALPSLPPPVLRMRSDLGALAMARPLPSFESADPADEKEAGPFAEDAGRFLNTSQSTSFMASILLSSSGPCAGAPDASVSGFAFGSRIGQREAPAARVTYKPLYKPRFQHTLQPVQYDEASKLAIKAPFLQNAVSLQQKNHFEWGGQKVRIIPRIDLMTGAHSFLAEIAPGQAPLLRGLNNADIVVKTFTDHAVMVKGAGKVGPGAAPRILDDHAALQPVLRSAGFDVAQLYNRDEAAANCGFFLFERVPRELGTLWEKGTPLSALTEEETILLDEICRLYKTIDQSNRFADLSPGNLRRRDDGTLTLIDFMEHETVGLDIKMDLINSISSFNCEKGDEIYEKIRSSVQDIDYDSYSYSNRLVQ